MTSANSERQRLYGRRLGRPLNAGRRDALESLLPALKLDDVLTENADLDPASLFEKPVGETWLEIGFGNGEHLAGLMARHPEVGFLGAEPFINGMAAFLKQVRDNEDLDPSRLRVYMEDALRIVDSLADAALSRIYILNPDPWPKTRHHKRRIVRPETLDRYARVLRPGGKLIMATDVAELAEWMATHTINHPAFSWDAERADDWRVMPQDWIPTRYETKGIAAGRVQTYLLFTRT